MDRDEIIYSISVEDIFTVIEQNEIDIELTNEDIVFLTEKIGENIDWFSCIESAIESLLEEKNQIEE